jgi:syntaxin 8
MATLNAARLASLSTKTLTLALERQRLISISNTSSSPLKTAAASSSSVAQITRNMTVLHDGIIQLETVQGTSKESKILRDQYKSVINVLGEQEAAEAGVQS